MESSYVALPPVFVIPSGAGREGKRIRGDDWARFWSKVDRSAGPTACWPWTDKPNRGGYGHFEIKKEDGKFGAVPAHRWLLGKLRGLPLTGGAHGIEDACHLCNNPICCNPLHLYVDNRSGNIKYAVSTGRHFQSSKEECPAGHEYTEANTYRTPPGERRCRQCREDQRPAQEARRKARMTHCSNDHELAGDNLIICKGGRRKCRKCEITRIEKAVAGRMRQLSTAA